MGTLIPRSALVALSLGFALLAGCVEPARVEREWTALGLDASAELYSATGTAAEESAAEIRSVLDQALRLFDPDRPGSALARLNAVAPHEPHPTESRDFFRCVLLALDYAEFSQSAFDPTAAPLRRLYREGRADDAAIERAIQSVGWDRVLVALEARAIGFRRPGMELDLDGIGAGCALDVAARTFSRPGSQAGLLRLGGVTYAWRSPPERELWDVALQDPRTPGRLLAHVAVADRGVAVAGPAGAEGRLAGRGFPATVVDPRTGRPATRVIAAAAIADSAADAEALSWALLVAGPQRGGAMLARANHVEALLLVRDAEGPYLLASASLDGRLRLSDELASEVGGSVRFLLPGID